MMADRSTIYTKAHGPGMDLTAGRTSIRSRRYSMLVETGAVKTLDVAQPGKFEVSDPEAMLRQP